MSVDRGLATGGLTEARQQAETQPEGCSVGQRQPRSALCLEGYAYAYAISLPLSASLSVSTVDIERSTVSEVPKGCLRGTWACPFGARSKPAEPVLIPEGRLVGVLILFLFGFGGRGGIDGRLFLKLFVDVVSILGREDVIHVFSLRAESSFFCGSHGIEVGFIGG